MSQIHSVEKRETFVSDFCCFIDFILSQSINSQLSLDRYLARINVSCLWIRKYLQSYAEKCLLGHLYVHVDIFIALIASTTVKHLILAASMFGKFKSLTFGVYFYRGYSKGKNA